MDLVAFEKLKGSIMKSNKFLMHILLALMCSAPSYAGSFDEISWSGDFFIEKINVDGSSLVIKRDYIVLNGIYTNVQYTFNYYIKCSAGEYPESIDFSDRNTRNFDVKNISLKENSSVRFDSRLRGAEVVQSVLNSQGLNLYKSGSGRKIGELSLRKISPFLEQHQALISECKVNFNKARKQKIAEALLLLIAFGVAWIAVAAFSYLVIRIVIVKLRPAKESMKILGASVAQNLTELKNKKNDKKMKQKIVESAVDEIVRQTVRRAMSEGVNPNEIVICSRCKGTGCTNCSENGWLVEK